MLGPNFNSIKVTNSESLENFDNNVRLNDIKKIRKKITSQNQGIKFKYRTLNLGSVKMFFTLENNQLVYKFI